MPGDAALSGERIGRALRLPPGSLLLLVFPLAKLLAHLLTGAGYGYHRDELYYLVCADHLDWGYVDHPPFSVAILAAVRAVAGDSVRAIRVVPALAGALTVLVVGLIARRLGGGAFACALAMACALAAPVYLALGQYYSMNAFDLLAWAVVGWLLVLVFTGGRPSLWLIAGVVLGLGLLNKASVLWLVCGLFVGMLATPQRSWLRTRWPWIAGGTALAMVLPHVLWQWKHGFPTALFVHNAVTNKMVPTTILGFLWGQVDTMLWPSAFIWGAGLVFLIGHPAASRVRALGIAYLVIFAFLALSRSSRMAYLSPAYTWLLPAGGWSWNARSGRWAPGRERSCSS